MHFCLQPWDSTQAPEVVEARQVSELFRDYFFEKKGKTNTSVSHNRNKALKWQAFRLDEYKQFQRQKLLAHPRHVFIRLEGTEGKLADFEYTFDKSSLIKAAKTPLSEDQRHALLLEDLKRQAVKALGFPEGRAVHLLWCLPNFDTATVRSDNELLELLHADPGVEDSARPTRLPPIYFTVSRDEYYFSEWAFSVRHHMLLQAPFALKASLQLLRDVRGDANPSREVCSLKDALALEFRFATKLAARSDFHSVGVWSNRSADAWETVKNKQESVVDARGESLRQLPTAEFDDVFERDVTIDGHHFVLRPRWSPRTLEEVRDEDIAALTAPLTSDTTASPFGVRTDLDVAVETNSAEHVFDTAKNIVGFEVVPRLGEVDDKGPAVPPLQSDAHVPTNVNFYEMARHPWADTPHSWRYNGFTESSQQYFVKKYEEAAKKVYDPENQGKHLYWPLPASNESGRRLAEEAAAAAGQPEPEEKLLQERFWGAIRKAEGQVEPWAQRAREASKKQKFDYVQDVTTSEEKVYDDNYYRWFIRPGDHPNPSGISRPASGGAQKS